MPLTTTISAPAACITPTTSFGMPEAVTHGIPTTHNTRFLLPVSETLAHTTTTTTPFLPPTTPPSLAPAPAPAPAPSTLPTPPSLPSSTQPPPSCQPLPLNISKHKNPLPSTSIGISLTTASNVMKKYPDMCGEGNASLLALGLAEEAFFGQDVLVRCTPKGTRGPPSLPVRELADLIWAMPNLLVQ